VIGEPPLKDDQRLQRDLMRLTQDLTVLSRQRARLMEAEARARQEAENANQQKERAIAMLAHELRQPLVPMRFALELLTADVPDSTR
jgi:signal transduction histidine kinase